MRGAMTMNVRAKTTGPVVAFILASAALSATAARGEPTSKDAQQVDNIRATIAASAQKALDSQGGSRILFKVDAGALREEMVLELRDDVYRTVREGRIPFTALTVREGGVEITIAQAKDRERVLSKLAPSAQGASPSRAATIAVTDGSDGLIRLAPTDAGFAERLHALVRDSMEMIEQRLRNRGIRQAGLQPDGADRIRVVLPGVTDPDPVGSMFSRKAHVTFRLVDLSMSAEDAVKGPLPPASEVLYDFRTKAPYLLLKEIAMEGDDIIDVEPGVDPATHQPIASFRFNARGTRHFARVTEENVGRPFAIVLDDKVLSVSIIREPITGGLGVISGNFTLEEANTMAMLLRSGTLAGRLSVVEQQVLQPAGNAAK